jgi:hypothetical protein
MLVEEPTVSMLSSLAGHAIINHSMDTQSYHYLTKKGIKY